MKYEDFKNKQKEKREEYKGERLKAKKEAIKLIDDSEETIIVITEKGKIECGFGIDLVSALSSFFASAMNEGTFTKEELMTCIKVAELSLSGDLDKIN